MSTALILKIMTFCKKHNLDEISIMICVKFGTIVMAINYLARGGGGTYETPFTFVHSDVALKGNC